MKNVMKSVRTIGGYEIRCPQWVSRRQQDSECSGNGLVVVGDDRKLNRSGGTFWLH